MARRSAVSWLPSVWGRKAMQGALVWESGQPWLHTPSGPILLAIPADMELPPVPLMPPGTSGDPVSRGAEVIVVGKRYHKDGRLVMAVRYFTTLGGRL